MTTPDHSVLQDDPAMSELGRVVPNGPGVTTVNGDGHSGLNGQAPHVTDPKRDQDSDGDDDDDEVDELPEPEQEEQDQTHGDMYLDTVSPACSHILPPSRPLTHIFTLPPPRSLVKI
jgi:hypothetical protein